MAYAQHALLSFSGSLGDPGDPADIWSCGIRLRTDNPQNVDTLPTQDDLQDYLDGTAIPALSDWFSRSETHISAWAHLTTVKVNNIGPEGRYLGESTVGTYDLDVNGGAGTSNSPQYPLQVSLVHTFTTDVTRGRGSSGRIFAPAPANTTLGAGGTFSVATAQEIATSTASLLSDLQTLGVNGPRFRPAVMSSLVAKGQTGDGAFNIITGVRVDTRLDIQRSRANSVSGARATAQVE